MKIEYATIVRTIVLLLALINQCLVMAGKPVIPIEDATVEAVVTGLFTIGAAVWGWWKNNSFTKAAIEGDKVMKEIKKG